MAHPLLVDGFSEAIQTLSLTSNPDSSIVTVGLDANLNVLGGSRTTTIRTTFQDVPGFDSTTVSYYTPAPGFMDDTSRVGWGGEISLSYGLGEIPSVLEGAIGLEIALLAFDGSVENPMGVSVRLVNLAGGPGTSGPTAFAMGGAQTLQVFFPEGVPLDTIDTLEVEFEVPVGGDFRLDSIYTVVPEPSSLALLALGIAGVGLFRRSA